MNFLAFWITAMFIIGSASTEGETLSDNELLTVEDEVEGRACYDCHGGQGGGHGGGGSHEVIDHTQIHYGSGGYENGHVGWWGFGFGGLAIIIVPIIGLNIAIVILLAIILKHLVKITEHFGYEEEPIYQPIYTGVSTYQTYDHGGAYGGGAANTGYGGGAVNSYGGSHVGGYKKRVSTDARSMADAPTVNFLSSIVGGALDKYAKVDVEE